VKRRKRKRKREDMGEGREVGEGGRGGRRDFVAREQRRIGIVKTNQPHTCFC